MNRKMENDEKLRLFEKWASKKSCVLKINGEYFGYDHDPAYPETLFKNIENAYIFETDETINDIVELYSFSRKEIEYEVIYLNDETALEKEKLAEEKR